MKLSCEFECGSDNSYLTSDWIWFYMYLVWCSALLQDSCGLDPHESSWSYYANLDVDQTILGVGSSLISLMLNKRRLIHIKIRVHLICRNSEVAVRIWIQMKRLLPNIKLNLFWWPFNSNSWNLCSTKKRAE